jgi:putative transposase
VPDAERSEQRALGEGSQRLARRALDRRPGEEGVERCVHVPLAGRFFRRLLAAGGDAAPDRITTDRLSSYAPAIARLRELSGAEHPQVRSALGCNNRVKQAHQPTRVRERVMRRFKSAASAQRFLDAFSRVSNLFRPGRHLLRAAAYRAVIRERAVTWREVAGLQAA